jgi:hypothetical protein
MIPSQGPWIQTFSGRAFHLKEPRVDDIDILDIAHSLAHQCRYGGHSRRFYSVAEHCILLSQVASVPNKFAALMHDASEAYLLDIPRPLKPLLTGYQDIERVVMNRIAIKFGFAFPLADEVKMLDAAIVSDEREQNMMPMIVDETWGDLPSALGVNLRFWQPAEASERFLDAFYALVPTAMARAA